MREQTFSQATAQSEYVLHRAAWVVPVSAPPVANGAVLARGDTILAVGAFGPLQAEAPAHTRRIDHGQTALLPALVNAHTHLELSGLSSKIPLPQKSFASWLEKLLPLRRALSPEDEAAGCIEGRRQLTNTGTGLCGDVGNGPRLPMRSADAISASHTFLEVLGFDQETLESAMDPEVLNALSEPAPDGTGISLAAHACYSTSAGIIRQAKEWCRRRSAPFSIHVAEHADEVEFLMDGTGFCRDLLEALGRRLDQWAPPRMTPVRYLDHLGVLDAQTLLVHNVHVGERDWEIVAGKNCSVCFCPRSNRNLNTGPADLEKPLRLGITAALGTDSLASNTDLNLFEEACYALDHYPGLAPRAALSMITLGGAKALGREDRYGCIGPGTASALLAVVVPPAVNSSQLMEIIIRQGKEGAWQWAHSAMND